MIDGSQGETEARRRMEGESEGGGMDGGGMERKRGKRVVEGVAGERRDGGVNGGCLSNP